jgi:endoglucanase
VGAAPKRRRLTATLAIIFAPLLAIGSVFAIVFLAPPPDRNPFTDVSLYADPDSLAANAAQDATRAGQAVNAALYQRLADTPAAIWLTPEEYPRGEVGTYVRQVTDDAFRTGRLPVFVVYGVPNRDCGNESSGGLSSTEDYYAWVGEIATAGQESSAESERSPIYIVEPDALALAQQCNNEAQRVGEVRSAVDILHEAEATIYLDGGHSTWRSAEDMAKLLNDAGIGEARGFASNVSNYNADGIEHDYAEKLSQLTGNSHYVIDTSRNGNGSNGDWCNPSGRALGVAPGIVTDGSHHDANLWIKAPGESDGQCNGGPVAGAWWPTSALELTRNAGW